MKNTTKGRMAANVSMLDVTFCSPGLIARSRQCPSPPRLQIVKVLANEDTLLLMMFLGLRKLGNICCGHKMFLNKIRNIFVSQTNVARAGKRGNIYVGNNVSATMSPCLPGPLG